MKVNNKKPTENEKKGEKGRETVGWSGGVTHHTPIVFFSCSTGNLEEQSSRTGKK